MRLVFRAFQAGLVCIALSALPGGAGAQQDALGGSEPLSPTVLSALPDAPTPQKTAAAVEPTESAQATTGDTDQSTSQETTGAGTSSSQPPAAQTDDEKKKRELAEEQLKAQEHQRVFGVMATFNTTRNQDALPLSPKQKFQLFFKSSTDPWPFLLASVVAGIGQADGSYPVWGQGLKGYAKRFGGAYTDAFIGNFFGNAVLTSLLKEDPRYFQKGTGSWKKRLLWAAASTVWCKRDNGKWGPKYANVGGNLIGAAIARTYYPASERTVGDTISDGLTVSAEGIVGSEVIEFWPDLVRRHRRKQAEKLARQEAEDAARKGAQPARASPAQRPQ